MSNNIDRAPVDTGRLCVGDRTGTGVTGGTVLRLRRLLRCNRGAVAVEFGLGAPLLLAALVPVADLGVAFAAQQQLRQAVQAGAQYAATHAWNQNAPAAITSAVTTATPLSGVSVSPAPYRVCGCPSGGAAAASGGGMTIGASGIGTATCGSTCANGETAGYYVVVSAELPYTPVLPYSLLGSSMILSAQSMVRTR
ncbi:MAG: TadE/TadG family type IV pilus assembly protein [Alphaproteobacteria bacterium]